MDSTEINVEHISGEITGTISMLRFKGISQGLVDVPKLCLGTLRKRNSPF